MTEQMEYNELARLARKPIGIIGYGVVGKATEVMLRKFFNSQMRLIIYDKKVVGTEIEPLVECGFIFVCLPTPEDSSGLCDTSLIEAAIAKVMMACQKKAQDADSDDEEPIFIIRSTVFPGTTEDIAGRWKARVFFMPEFLTESTFWDDAQNPALIVLGGKGARVLFNVLFPSAMTTKEFPSNLCTDSTTAELLKYALNTFFAVKVIFANQIYDIADNLGARYDQIAAAIQKHPFVGVNHFDVWHGGYRGYGGKCLPKDTSAIAFGCHNEFFQMVHRLNKQLIDVQSLAEKEVKCNGGK